MPQGKTKQLRQLSWREAYRGAGHNPQQPAVQALLQARAMLDVANEDGETAFSIARRSGNYEEFEVMHLLFAAGATVREDEFQMDPHVLASACANGNDALVQALLQAGAPVDVPCPISKETPLTAAAAAGHDTVVQTLVHARAEIDRPAPRDGYKLCSDGCS